MKKADPEWLAEARGFCRQAGITIMAWGPDMLTVEAQSPDRAKGIASQLGQLNFKPIEDEDDAVAGLLSLSRNPAASCASPRKNLALVDISRRPARERVAPLLEGLLCLWLFWFGITEAPPGSRRFVALAFLCLAILLWDGVRLLGWRLQMSSEELRVRRYFRWSAIPWRQIRSVELTGARSPYQQGVTLTLAPKGRFRIGAFGCSFALALRDRLREEIAHRRDHSQVYPHATP
jgi:hypothetical protein